MGGNLRVLDPATGAAYMPRLGFNENFVKCMSWICVKRKIDYASFDNGRRRARYLACAGTTSIPVENAISDPPLVREYCGFQ